VINNEPKLDLRERPVVILDSVLVPASGKKALAAA
jgi:hypothetical protein